jgi:ABC-2 type transport system permease protein/lipopolysaccharide transport system permease protein
LPEGGLSCFGDGYDGSVSSPSDVSPWRENAATLGRKVPVWVTIWRCRDLIGFFALRDLRVRYKQAVLGVLWVLLIPIISVVVFTVVFSRLAKISSEGVPYPLFCLVGLVAWSYFSRAVGRGSEVLVGNPQLVTKVAFPRLAAPAAAMLPPLVDLAVSMVLVLLMFAYYRFHLTWRLLATPAWVALLVLGAFGVALWLSALNVRYRDVQHAVVPLMQVWLFASPVAYPSSLLSGWQELLYALNPMTGIIGLARWSVLGTPWPGWPLAVSVAVVALTLLGGLAYFRRAERSFADVI